MSKLIDMHIHTVYSDGECSPKEIVDLVKKSDVGTFSITDHDTILGVKELYGKVNDLKFIPGIELTGEIEKGRLHVLGYGLNPFDKHLNEVMDDLRINSIKRVMLMIKYIHDKYNITFKESDIENLYNAVGNIGRPDIAKLCLKYGYVNNTREAFVKYLIEAHDAVSRGNGKLTAKDCLELITNSGGIPVLAHPISLEKNYKDLEDYIIELIANGLRGIEVYHSQQDKNYSDMLLSLADHHDLLVSGGSDYHGPILKPDVKIGSGVNNNIKIKKLSILKHL